MWPIKAYNFTPTPFVCNVLQHGFTSHGLSTTVPCSWFRVIPENSYNSDHNEILPKPIQFALYYDTIMQLIITSL
jgi:hypothetical protein